MRLGKAAMEALQAEICGQLSPGNELVVAGAVALKGTALIAKEKHEILREHFSQGFLADYNPCMFLVLSPASFHFP